MATKPDVSKIIKISIIGALGGGLLSFLFFLVLLFTINENPLGPSPVRVLDFWIPGFTLVFTLWYFKLQKPNRVFHIWEGFLGGAIITFGLSLTSALLFYAFLEWVRPDVLTDYIKQSLALVVQLKQNTITQFGEKAYKQQLESLPLVTAGSILKDEFIRKIFYGIFVIPVVSIMLRKQDLK